MSIDSKIEVRTRTFEWSFARLGNEYAQRSPEFLFANRRLCFEWLEPGLSQMQDADDSNFHESLEYQCYMDWLERPHLSLINPHSKSEPVNIDFSAIRGVVEATLKRINRQNTEIKKHCFCLQPSKLEYAFTYSTDLYLITSYKITFNFPEKVIVYSEASPKKGECSKQGYQCIENLIEDLKSLWINSTLSDVELKCEDGRSVKAHKVILGARSKVFAAMFQSDMEESRSGVVKIPDMDAESLETFLHYIYTGTLPDLTMDTAKQWYMASDKYCILELKTICAKFLADNISVENVCDLLVIADLHSDSDLKEKAIAYILEKKIPCKTDHWAVLAKSHPDLAVQVLTKAYEMQNS